LRGHSFKIGSLQSKKRNPYRISKKQWEPYKMAKKIKPEPEEEEKEEEKEED